LLACQGTTPVGPSPETAQDFPTAVAATTAAPTAPAPADTGWIALRPGLERRLLDAPVANGLDVEKMYLLRIDPAAYRFDVAYRPGQPQSLAQWQAATGALVVVNGGYFTAEQTATGLIVVAGQASGTSYREFGGMLAITAVGPELRWLPARPYDPSEPLLAAVQSFPMLMLPGGEPGYPEDDGLPNRRTVIAQDDPGRIVILVAPSGHFTLNELGRFLAASDLSLVAALNLDGGTSSGIRVADPLEEVPAFVPLPVVITIYPK
jgi:hypothetical protein